MAGDLNSKHVDWNSRLITRRRKPLRDYADENSCLIFGPDTPTTNPFNPSDTPYVLDIALEKKLPFPVYVTSFSALSSDHLPVLIETACRSSFQHPPDRPYFRRTVWANFQTHLEDQIPFDLELHNGMAIDTCVENVSGAVLQHWWHLLSNVAHVTPHGLRYKPAFRMRYARKSGFGGDGRTAWTPAAVCAWPTQ